MRGGSFMKETKNKKTNLKKTLGSILALVLVAVVSVVGTLAYLQTKTRPVQNTFTGSGDISLKVEETEWDKSGKTLAESYTPGLTIPKDPLLTNDTGKDYSEWVAIRVDYYKDGVSTSYDNFAKSDENDTSTTKVIEPITFNTADWINVTDEVTETDAKYQVYVYKTKLDNGASTNKLFEEVKINNNLEKGTDDKYPTFDIYISGAAIKVESSHSSISSLSDTDAEVSNIKAALIKELEGITIS